jgi:hypothetical protein
MSKVKFGELEIDESDDRPAKQVSFDGDTIVFKNSSGRAVSSDDLTARLVALPGIETITSLVVDPSSRLEDLAIVAAFPNLVNAQINGSHIRSLEGLAAFHKGRYLNIDTGANRQRDIASVADAPIVKLSLHYARPQDLEAIARSSTINHLELGASPQPPFERWTHVPISILALSGGIFKELGNTAAIPTLHKLALIGCRRLEALTGDNSNITWLAIQGSSRLRLDTAASFTNLESMFIVGIQQELAFSALGHLERLRTVSLENCKVDLDVASLSATMPQLVSLHIQGLNPDHALQLSRTNPSVSFSTGYVTYKNGLSIE